MRIASLESEELSQASSIFSQFKKNDKEYKSSFSFFSVFESLSSEKFHKQTEKEFNKSTEKDNGACNKNNDHQVTCDTSTVSLTTGNRSNSNNNRNIDNNSIVLEPELPAGFCKHNQHQQKGRKIVETQKAHNKQIGNNNNQNSSTSSDIIINNSQKKMVSGKMQNQQKKRKNNLIRRSHNDSVIVNNVYSEEEEELVLASNNNKQIMDKVGKEKKKGKSDSTSQPSAVISLNENESVSNNRISKRMPSSCNHYTKKMEMTMVLANTKSKEEFENTVNDCGRSNVIQHRTISCYNDKDDDLSSLSTANNTSSHARKFNVTQTSKLSRNNNHNNRKDVSSLNKHHILQQYKAMHASRRRKIIDNELNNHNESAFEEKDFMKLSVDCHDLSIHQDQKYRHGNNNTDRNRNSNYDGLGAFGEMDSVRRKNKTTRRRRSRGDQYRSSTLDLASDVLNSHQQQCQQQHTSFEENISKIKSDTITGRPVGDFEEIDLCDSSDSSSKKSLLHQHEQKPLPSMSPRTIEATSNVLIPLKETQDMGANNRKEKPIDTFLQENEDVEDKRIDAFLQELEDEKYFFKQKLIEDSEYDNAQGEAHDTTLKNKKRKDEIVGNNRSEGSSHTIRSLYNSLASESYHRTRSINDTVGNSDNDKKQGHHESYSLNEILSSVPTTKEDDVPFYTLDDDESGDDTDSHSIASFLSKQRSTILGSLANEELEVDLSDEDENAGTKAAMNHDSTSSSRRGRRRRRLQQKYQRAKSLKSRPTFTLSKPPSEVGIEEVRKMRQALHDKEKKHGKYSERKHDGHGRKHSESVRQHNDNTICNDNNDGYGGSDPGSRNSRSRGNKHHRRRRSKGSFGSISSFISKSLSEFLEDKIDVAANHDPRKGCDCCNLSLCSSHQSDVSPLTTG